jgi:hypothetical protein
MMMNPIATTENKLTKTDKLKKALLEPNNVMKELTPYIEEIINQLNSKSEAFDAKKTKLTRK